MMFLDLPEDIRVAICAYISSEDLLVLKQVGAMNPSQRTIPMSNLRPHLTRRRVVVSTLLYALIMSGIKRGSIFPWISQQIVMCGLCRIHTFSVSLSRHYV
jgi:hypothetical protein